MLLDVSEIMAIRLMFNLLGKRYDINAKTKKTEELYSEDYTSKFISMGIKKR